LFVEENSFPLIDEPTNHLDFASREKVANYLKNKKQGFIVASHDKNFLDEVSDHTLAIDKAKIQLFQGNYSVYQEETEKENAKEEKANEKISKEISRLKTTAKEKEKWGKSRESDISGNPHIKGSGSIGDKGFITARAARQMKKMKHIEKRTNRQIEEKETLLKNIEYIEPLKMNFQPTFHKNLLRLEKFTLKFTKDVPNLFAPITMNVNMNDCVAIVGINGIGKTQLLLSILKEFTGQTTGILSMPQNISISYVSQHFEKNRGTLTEFCEEKKISYQDFLSNLKKLGLERDAFTQKIEEMSMGQRKKIELAKSLTEPAELYIWDEPLNYLDIYNQQQIIELLEKVQPTMILVEHDKMFIEEVATKTLELKEETHE
jgi:lincosamide and streptogramin A transport system ATP-binding/permease protein